MIRGRETGGRAAIPASFYQCRVSPTIKKITDKYPINYDSTLIFPIKEMAEKYMSMFIRQLYEGDFLAEKQEYTTSIIQLATYIPEVSEYGN
jgi:hypothetical protein